MNNALFAIPGLMPPTAPKFHSRIIAPEDGSLCLCVHCGSEYDVVNYAVDTPGPWRGAIKDPSYNYGPMSMRAERKLRDYLANLPQFVTVSEVLPPDAIVPRMLLGDCPVPITERPDLCRPLYWILRLPLKSLPVGDTIVEVVINGRLRKYTVQRPAFAIHRRRDITPRFRCETNQKGEQFDVAIEEGSTRVIRLDIIDAIGDPLLLDGAEYRAECILNGEVTELDVTVEGTDVLVTIPVLPAGQGVWRVYYKMFTDWDKLSSGDLYIVPTNKHAVSHDIVLAADAVNTVEQDISGCAKEDLTEAEFRATLFVNAELVDATSVTLIDATTLEITIPAMSVGTGMWVVQYNTNGEWLDLFTGSVKIESK